MAGAGWPVLELARRDSIKVVVPPRTSGGFKERSGERGEEKRRQEKRRRKGETEETTEGVERSAEKERGSRSREKGSGRARRERSGQWRVQGGRAQGKGRLYGRRESGATSGGCSQDIADTSGKSQALTEKGLEMSSSLGFLRVGALILAARGAAR
jgi:hypothetical protein